MGLPAAGHVLHTVELEVNGAPRVVSVEPWTTLVDLLREHLGLTGTKKGCDRGQCGACTVIVNGQRVNSCLTLVVMAAGARVTTIEGVSRGEMLHLLQKAFMPCSVAIAHPGRFVRRWGFSARAALVRLMIFAS
jgi:xanthine dehydrogenase YagT iron-sulfur-binding subunit